MATVLQNLNKIMLGGAAAPSVYQGQGAMGKDEVLFSTNDKAEYDAKLAAMKQQKLLSYQWVKAGNDVAMDNLSNYSATKLMFRDADLMDAFPEISAALDIASEEATCLNSKGRMLNIYSSSPRIKAILEDLFVNRLHINTTLPMITREMLKYGNNYELLNIDIKEGIIDWKKLPVYEMLRNERSVGYGGVANVAHINTETGKIEPDKITFTWEGHNPDTPYGNWQVAHFRMLNDGFFLPYGTSFLHKARRAWRMLSMMEDAMLLYRLERSVERRVFKVFVGGIDDADVPAFVQEVANKFKRTPIVDPQTGQIDLRQNYIPVNADYFIPVRSETSPNPIETLAAAQNPTSMEDMNYMRDKILAALRIPKTFLNFQEAQGKGQNLSLMDIRFCRMVNKIQQYLLLELNKVAMVHLYILGMHDDLTNFTLSMNNPSAQIEALELEDLTKRLNVAQTALSDPGIGMPILSLHKVLKEVMKMTDAEIKDMLNEMRLEKALAAELQSTSNVIKKTGIFDIVDNIYGDPNATMPPAEQGEDNGGPMGGGPGGTGGDMGGSLEMNSLGGPDDMGGDIGGEPSEGGMGEAPSMDAGTPPPPTSGGVPLSETRSMVKKYFELLDEAQKKDTGDIEITEDYIGKNNVLINEIKHNIDRLSSAEQTIDKNSDILEEALYKMKGGEDIEIMDENTER